MSKKTSENPKDTSVKKTSTKVKEQAIQEPVKIAKDSADLLVENKLRALYELQAVDSAIDKIKILRGELPLEVQDLEDEVVGLQTRLDNIQQEIKDLDASVLAKKVATDNAKQLITKYEEQQKNVRNNREFDSISKEIEFQGLEMELNEKHIKEFNFQIKEKKMMIENSKELLNDKQIDLANKKQELQEITQETSIEEQQLMGKAAEYRELIDARLLSAYDRLRKNAQNGLAVAVVKRDACGGCFNKIPPQRQVDIKLSKKIIVCEYCGRILVDADIAG